MPRVLVVGSGGREHALCWKLAQDCEVVCAPGNPGIAAVAACRAVSATDIEGLLALAEEVQPDLVVVGPEAPLISGLADHLRLKGFAVFGPGKNGAELEASKAWSKELMHVAGVPTALSITATTVEKARHAAEHFWNTGRGVVVKASGAALGKGVVVCADLEESYRVIDEMLGGSLGSAGTTLVIEECLKGREFSLMTLVNERSVMSLPVAQDYKRVYDGDEGPNTGGMGSYAPVPWVTPELVARTEKEVVWPVIKELARRGIVYRGVLFSGLMADGDDLRCLEYNVRFGDPETQSIMRVVGAGFYNALVATARGEVIPAVEATGQTAVTVVMASEGYPGEFAKGKPVSLMTLNPWVEVFHAGTALQDGLLVTSGGRVLGVSAIGADVERARETAYHAVGQIYFEGSHARKDIAAS
jgi:phosphoribosylamine--glycine ligase